MEILYLFVKAMILLRCCENECNDVTHNELVDLVEKEYERLRGNKELVDMWLTSYVVFVFDIVKKENL